MTIFILCTVLALFVAWNVFQVVATIQWVCRKQAEILAEAERRRKFYFERLDEINAARNQKV